MRLPSTELRIHGHRAKRHLKDEANGLLQKNFLMQRLDR
jgi:hypothetical protein